MPLTLTLYLRRYICNSTLLYNLRILIALAGTTGLPWWLDQITWTIPLTLGVVAAALTDLDDRLTGRLRNLLITLVCFCVASVSVELLSPYPWLFVIGLALSTWGFILLGALGQRYATIAFGALLIAIYTLLGVGLFPQWYLQPSLLLIGAIWYNLLTLTGHLIFPIRPLQENIARSFEGLAVYLEAKASLFDPDAIEEKNDRSLIDVAMANSQLVATLNETKISIQSRLRGDRGQRGTRRTLHYYFVAQDIHERASSSHVQYHFLRQEYRYSDILFRFQRLLSLQGKACQQLAHCILMREIYQHDDCFDRAFVHLNAALERLRASRPSSRDMQAMTYLLHNLKAIDAQLATIESEQDPEQDPASHDQSLSNEDLNGWTDIRLRISRHLTPHSALFRHAVRLSLLLCSGYSFIKLTGMEHGYWILLTSLFVCQPNYNATKRRLALRIVGTVGGIIVGLPLLLLVPSVEGQLVLIVLSGVLFFAFRQSRYANATLFITLLVLCCFSLLGEGFDIALPRIIDTLIGCGIAWLAVAFIWPDWRFRRLSSVTERTMETNCRYLDAILVQYHQGKDNRLDYRIARRDAHNSDAELASVVSNISAEKNTSATLRENAFHLLCLNHSFLSYISALGAHREKITSQPMLQLMDDTVCYVGDILLSGVEDEAKAQRLLNNLSLRIEAMHVTPETKEPLVLQQVGLLIALLPEIAQSKKQIMSG
ncbi:YccS family putative transporter [Erwinia psidii]|uniref:TIGR01666 family membrane protein n=1 Tax=Erwinia psidii TaxID=69224 RepID=A0A3N6SE43_9GAMM|nr:YccS family putative transporter [Erwinia psidii]MCX8957429.1 TIGR01666 family membrane protein [Erwinia psidii]MCX8959798.1 TIGR01666 family membrane protein [Erwinia psidii]RQM38153.1 TIGR01666 family membrane protein [Erwinia psidii]